MAIGAIRAIRKAGLRIPEDVSLVGFDNIPISTAIYPALTTVAQPIPRLAKTIAHLLIERIQKAHEACPSRQITLETHLVVRDSCAALA
jgi:DNA-binding LacI/PurR family transcriptional regulator